METPAPEVSDYELERGKPRPSLNRALIQRNLLLLNAGLGADYLVLPELSLALDVQKAVPDVSVFPRGALDLSAEQISVTVVPRTAIEILSPTQVIPELLEKAKRYFAAGVQSYWMAVPDLRAVAVFSELGKYQYFYNGQTLTDPATGAEIAISQLFD
ncbi:Uma2 family endonuclease [Hymenobacter sp. BT664]|uniref:Uma2 family endonuclease n=1 Tax=Hymenobacter montanus TaxID=2771359 RepID=A0A927BDN5_9BACT|nr:Uma2 family endonuclease [Hymenobacter montanus]MBD2768244.1 Uma2 family endonuclease [Hymenobacter montanus]